MVSIACPGVTSQDGRRTAGQPIGSGLFRDLPRDRCRAHGMARFNDLEQVAAAEAAAISQHRCMAPQYQRMRERSKNRSRCLRANTVLMPLRYISDWHMDRRLSRRSASKRRKGSVAAQKLVEGGRGVSLRALPIRYKGQSYKNLAALAEAFNLPVKRLESRLRLGWIMQDPLTLPRNMVAALPYKRSQLPGPFFCPRRRRQRISGFHSPDGASAWNAAGLLNKQPVWSRHRGEDAEE